MRWRLLLLLLLDLLQLLHLLLLLMRLDLLLLLLSDGLLLQIQARDSRKGERFRRVEVSTDHTLRRLLVYLNLLFENSVANL